MWRKLKQKNVEQNKAATESVNAWNQFGRWGPEEKSVVGRICGTGKSLRLEWKTEGVTEDETGDSD